MKVTPSWHVRIDNLEGLVTVDQHGRPVQVLTIDPDELTIPNAKKLTSTRVLNAITAQRGLNTAG